MPQTLKQYCYLFTISLFYSLNVFSQTSNCEAINFSYDALGNRILRELIVEPCDDSPDQDDGPSGNRLAQQTEQNNQMDENTASIVVFPNPTENQLFVKADERLIISECILYDIQGKRILQVKPNSRSLMISVENLNKGTYILSVYSDGGKENFKITKK